MTKITLLGLDIRIIVVILFLAVIFMALLIVTMNRRITLMNQKYKAVMSGKKGADLEKIIRIRFKEMDKVKANAKKLNKEHKEIQKKLKSCYCKLGIIKYDAFEKMSGKLSFTIALLNEDNSGIVYNSMHTREGCFTYAKEIINGESYIPLSGEEKEAIEKAKTIEEVLDNLNNDLDKDLIFDFDTLEDAEENNIV